MLFPPQINFFMKGDFHMGFISLIVAFIPMIIFILFLIFGIRFALRLERRSEERLKIDKENTSLLQQQIREINDRLTAIEKVLKEVD